MMRLDDLAKMAGLEVRRDATIGSLGFLQDAVRNRLVFAVDRHNLAVALGSEGVAAILTTGDLAGPKIPRGLGPTVGLAIAADPRRTFFELHNRLATETEFYGHVGATRIDASADIHPGAHIDPAGVVIGAACRIGPGAILLEGTELEAGVRVTAGAVLGGNGFQIMRVGDQVLDLRHAGRLHISARSIVMDNAVVARAVFNQTTRIGPDCRIGNGAFVSHNCVIGARGLIGHGAVVCGNCEIGDDVVLGPGTVCVNQLRIGTGATVIAGSVIVRSVDAGATVGGNPAVDHSLWKRNAARRRRQSK